MKALGSCLFLGLAACASGYATTETGHPTFVIPHHIAEGKGEGSDLPPKRTPASGAPTTAASASPAGSSSAAAPAAPPPLSGSAPDPEALSMAEQWEYQMLYQNGAPTVEGVQHRVLPKPVSTPRRMGRFALELWIGKELVDRVRFDFPIIGAEEQPGVKRRPLHDSPSLAPHAIARIRVSLPASPRATRLVLVDRATQKSQDLPWPPDREPAAVPELAAPTPQPQ